jgi:putative MATE family efflux protein
MDAAPASLSKSPPSAPSFEPLTQRLLEGRIVPLILRLAWPNVLIMLVQSGTALIDTWWLAKLGNDALGGMALVFPFVMLIGTISGGSIGAGISACVARALGARRPAEANAVLLHGIVVNLAFGLMLTAVMLLFGREIFSATGGRGGVLEAALDYAQIVFAGNTLLWLMNGFASVIRGTGNMLVPALVTCGGVLIMIPLSPCLIFGLGPFPPLGIAGSALSLVTYYAVGAAILGWYIVSGRCVVKFARTPLRWSVFAGILGIGALGALISLQMNLTAALNNALVAAAAGAGAVAGFGTAARLEFLMVPIGFGLGAPLVALVGTNVGAGDRGRALRIVLAGSAIAFAVTESIGLCAAIFPEAWLGLFTHEPGAVAVGSTYLRHVGPAFGFYGLGVGIYFALLGARKLFWPVVAGFARMFVAMAGGACAVLLFGSLNAMFVFLAIALIVYGVIPLLAVRRTSWQRQS